jgi:hypothetical protein
VNGATPSICDTCTDPIQALNALARTSRRSPVHDAQPFCIGLRSAGITAGGKVRSMSTILLVILILLLLGALPTWPYSAGWGYYPSGGLGLVLLIIIILLVLGRI